MARWFSMLLALSLVSGPGGCRERDVAESAAAQAARGPARPEPLADKLAPGHAATVEALGAHRLEIDAVIAAASKRIAQHVVLDVDAEGQYAANKTIGRQHGHEAIYVGGTLYSRLRYSKFLKRRLAPDKAARFADRFQGQLSAYLALLGPWLHTRRIEERSTTVGGRPVTALELRLGKKRGSVESKGAARRWRATVEVEQLQGLALLDQQTGIPLRIELDARWSHAPAASQQPPNGIPQLGSAGKRGQMTLRYRHKLTIGSAEALRAPAPEELLGDPRRMRLELERQFVTGERATLPDDWPLVVPRIELQEPKRE